MPTRSSKQSYGATAFVATFWVGILAITTLAKPFVPEDRNDSLSAEPGDFMRPAREQRVNWRVFDTSAINDARRLNRPLFIFSGTSWSLVGKRVDNLMRTSEVAEFLNREFVCVRIDHEVNRTWRSGLVPILRAARGDDPTFGAYIVTPQAELIDAPGEEVLMSVNDRRFLGYLRRVLNRYAAKEVAPTTQIARDEQFALCGGTESGTADLDLYIDQVQQSLDLKGGGLAAPGLRRIPTVAWELLLDEGLSQNVRESLDPLLLSPALDWMNGGMHEYFLPATPTQVQFVRTTSGNASLLRTLSRLAATTNDPWLFAMAERQFESVDRSFALPESPIVYRDDMDDLNRSPRQSFRPNALPQILSGNQLTLAQRLWNLDPWRNPQMSPFISKPDDYLAQREEADAVLEKLATGRDSSPPNPNEASSFGRTAEAVAALHASARLLGNTELKARATERFTNIRQVMRTGPNDVYAGLFAQTARPGDLLSYVSYAEAAWETFLSSGDPTIALDGLEVLRRGLFLFSDENGNLRAEILDEFPVEWQNALLPEVLDSPNASLVSRVAIIARLYGLWPGSKDQQSILRERSDQIVRRSAAIFDNLNYRGAGMARAARLADRPNPIGIVGSADWPLLEKQFPGVPIIRLERPEGTEPAGYYVLEAGNWVGPAPYSTLAERIANR